MDVNKLKKYKWSDNPEAQLQYKNVTYSKGGNQKQQQTKIEKLEKELEKLKTRNKVLGNIAKREADRWRQTKKRKRLAQGKIAERLCNGFGYCIKCSCLDLDILEEHHVFGANYDEFTVTMCPNCHRRIHKFLGVTLGSTSRR